VVELFAGVGGFRLGLERAGWQVIWSNQWEPGASIQYASDCYVGHFGPEGHVSHDIRSIASQLVENPVLIPDHDLLVGGFPCQDYSVAKPLRAAVGILGEKGSLWSSIRTVLEIKRPRFVFLENVDRLLKSPGDRRGRDFAIILASLRSLGYVVEWRVVNAADYGFPQRRRRVFILARPWHHEPEDPTDVVFSTGVLSQAFPVKRRPIQSVLPIGGCSLDRDIDALASSWDQGGFGDAGFLDSDGKAHFFHPEPRRAPRSKRRTLGDITSRTQGPIPDRFFVDEDKIGSEKCPAPGTWRYVKGAKSEPRTKRVDGSEFAYEYKEGAIAFPDRLDEPARTILTSEGGSSPSRTRHIISAADGYRRLTPDELERLNGFPAGWTKEMPDSRRAFMMGNALVVGLVRRVGIALSSGRD
jgi:DNA (cytosine-5)-methyltransferase 1